jgi:hypothetical protein
MAGPALTGVLDQLKGGERTVRRQTGSPPAHEFAYKRPGIAAELLACRSSLIPHFLCCAERSIRSRSATMCRTVCRV